MTQEALSLPIALPDRKQRIRRRVRRSLVVLAIFLALLVLLLWYVGVLGGNVRVVTPGKVYRSGQLTGHTFQSRTAQWAGNTLDAVIRQNGIKTIINLRGGSSKDDWFREEASACERSHVNHVTLSFSAVRMPPPDELRKLLHTFDTAAYPVLFHCRGGSDRSGLAGVLYKNIYEHVPLREAEESQLTWRYGHLSWGQAHAMNDFLSLYREKNDGLGLREWIENRYPALYATLPSDLKTLGPDVSPAAIPR